MAEVQESDPKVKPPPTEEEQRDLEEKARKIWKIFGRHTHAGRVLHQVYQLPRAIKIDYPKPKPKPKTEETIQTKVLKPCPQKAKIEYPPAKVVETKKIAKVDLIPKRKNYDDIKREIDEFYSVPYIPPNKGVDRELMKDKLQKKFKNSRGALPKKAELPQLNDDEENQENFDENEKEIKDQALKKINKKKFLPFLAKENKWDVEEKKENKPGDERAELMEMYDKIIEEMEERQNYLESIQGLDEPKIKEKIKKEIIDRVSELQKISEMLRDLRKK